MFLKIGMEGRDLPHLLLLRSGAELPEGYSRGEGISVSFCQPRCGKKVAIGHCVRLAALIFSSARGFAQKEAFKNVFPVAAAQWAPQAWHVTSRSTLSGRASILTIESALQTLALEKRVSERTHNGRPTAGHQPGQCSTIVRVCDLAAQQTERDPERGPISASEGSTPALAARPSKPCRARRSHDPVR
jgi:hypothetical protein